MLKKRIVPKTSKFFLSNFPNGIKYEMTFFDLMSIENYTKLMKNFTKENVVVIHSAFGEKPHTVAFVEVDKSLSDNEKLEIAFTKTNSINDAWWNNEGVTTMFPDKTCRSTSVGDMVLVGKEKYKCEMSGWSKI